MNRQDASTIVQLAISQLLENDAALLELDVTERALSHKLAEYMARSERIRPPLTVDCEYNRHFGDPKRLNLPYRKALDRELRATTVFPDIVVHERNTDERNIIVLEVKKPDGGLAYDKKKLKAFRKKLHYVHAGHVILGRTRRGEPVYEVRWIDG